MPIKNPLLIFISLQFLDLATTLTAVRMGGTELNPMIARMMAVGPVTGLLISKTIVIGLAAGGSLMGKKRGIGWANVCFMGIIAWNLTIIGRLALAAHAPI